MNKETKDWESACEINYPAEKRVLENPYYRVTAREECETCKWRESEIGYPSKCPTHQGEEVKKSWIEMGEGYERIYPKSPKVEDESTPAK